MNDSIYKSKFGFSLIEIVIGISIIGVVGGALALILNRTYKGANKTNLLVNLKQNGQTAINNIEGSIRQSEGIACPQTTTPSDTIVIQTKEEGEYLRFRFIPQPSDKSKNGVIVKDLLMLTNPIQVELLCSLPPSNPEQLTDKDEESGVSLIRGDFTVLKNRGVKDVVTVDFELGPPVKAGASYDTTLQNNVSFKTSIQLR